MKRFSYLFILMAVCSFCFVVARVGTVEPDDDGSSALKEAIEAGDIAAVRAIRSQGISYQTLFGGRTVLHIAAASGRTWLVHYFIRKGVPVSTPDSMGRTPLHDAADHGHIGAARALLMHGASVDAEGFGSPLNAPDGRGWTPLHYAADHGFVEIVRLLYRYGARVDVADNSGYLPIQVAMAADKNEAVSVLREWTPIAVARTPAGATVVHCAVEGGDLSALETLLASGLDVNAADVAGFTPLHKAVIKQNMAAVELLLQAGADAHQPDNDGQSPLQCAYKVLSELANNGTSLVAIYTIIALMQPEAAAAGARKRPRVSTDD